jgi:hypothetical protein
VGRDIAVDRLHDDPTEVDLRHRENLAADRGQPAFTAIRGIQCQHLGITCAK